MRLGIQIQVPLAFETSKRERAVGAVDAAPLPHLGVCLSYQSQCRTDPLEPHLKSAAPLASGRGFKET